MRDVPARSRRVVVVLVWLALTLGAPLALLLAVAGAASGTETPTPVDASAATPTPTGTGPTDTTASPPPPTDTPTSDATTPTPTDTSTPTATTEAPTSQPPTPSASATPTPTRVPVTRPATAPAVQSSDVSLPTLLLAVGALVAAGLVVVAVARRTPTAERPVASLRPPPGAGPQAGTAATLVNLGETMIDSGYPVTAVQTSLARVAAAGGAPDAAVIVLPTALFVTVPGESTMETAVAVAGATRLRLDQVEAVSRIVAGAESGAVPVADVRERLDAVRSSPAPYGPGIRTLGYVVLSAGLALILQASGVELVVAATLGAMVGALQLVAPRLSSVAQAVLPVLAAFTVSLVVFLLARTGLDVGVFAPLIAPLVTFLPGALLTTAVVELSTGQMISGAGRLAAGAMSLVLLAVGILAAAQLVGVPATVVGSQADEPLAQVAPWLGVALFGAGVVVHHCATRTALPWILLVLYVAYGAQVVGGLFLGGVLSAFVGALAMAPVAVFVAAQPSGPPTQVTFLPAFWLLVPGALALVGVTQLFGDDRSDGVSSLVTTGATMVGIALGVLIGLALGSSAATRLARLRPGGPGSR